MTTSDATAASAAATDSVLDLGLVALRALLPADWKVHVAAEPAGADAGADAMVDVQAPDGYMSRLVVQAQEAFAPRDAEGLLGGQLRLLRRLDSRINVVVFASWLSARTRALLEAQDVGYLDLTGNARLHLDRPTVVIRTTGADQDPRPAPRRGDVSVRGAIAGRVVRLLVDTSPPYTTSEIARTSEVSLAYVSRLLAALDREALVRRGPRGVVLDADWPNLLRRRAETYSLYATNTAHGYVSGTGAREAAQRLRADPDIPYRAVTGSFAAAQRAPITAPSQLSVYVDDAETTAEAMGLLPTDRGADVILLRPYDDVVLREVDDVDGLRVVVPSQLALDCLAGNGRMPAEGEALLTWMGENQAQWRRPSLDDVPPSPAARA